MQIKNTTLVADLIKEHPDVQGVINQILPEYETVKQEPLRASIMKILTIEHIAQKKGMEVGDILKTIRTASGALEQQSNTAGSYNLIESDPEWITGEPATVVNGSAMLAKGEHPLQLISEEMEKMQPDNYLILVTDFPPHPLIGKMNENGYKTHSRTDSEDPKIHLTWIGK